MVEEWILIGLSPHATELIPANKMKLFRIQ